MCHGRPDPGPTPARSCGPWRSSAGRAGRRWRRLSPCTRQTDEQQVAAICPQPGRLHPHRGDHRLCDHRHRDDRADLGRADVDAGVQHSLQPSRSERPDPQLRAARQRRLRTRRHAGRVLSLHDDPDRTDRPAGLQLGSPGAWPVHRHLHMGRLRVSRPLRRIELDPPGNECDGFLLESGGPVGGGEHDRHRQGLQRVTDLSLLSPVEPMKAILLLLKDRRRSQRGSVLSAVLIIVAFLSIISGALMTELSGNLIESRALVSRVTREATVNSAAELAINQLQSAPLGSPCPGPTTVNLNGLKATAAYTQCAPVVDKASLPLVPIVQASPFTVDGTRVQLPAVYPQGLDAYLVSDAAGGNVYEFGFG